MFYLQVGAPNNDNEVCSIKYVILVIIKMQYGLLIMFIFLKDIGGGGVLEA